MIQITREFADEMINRILGLMNHYRFNPQAADYCCEFCGMTAETNQGPERHSSDCDGKIYIATFEKAIATATKKQLILAIKDCEDVWEDAFKAPELRVMLISEIHRETIRPLLEELAMDELKLKPYEAYIESLLAIKERIEREALSKNG